MQPNAGWKSSAKIFRPKRESIWFSFVVSTKDEGLADPKPPHPFWSVVAESSGGTVFVRGPACQSG